MRVLIYDVLTSVSLFLNDMFAPFSSGWTNYLSIEDETNSGASIIGLITSLLEARLEVAKLIIIIAKIA